MYKILVVEDDITLNNGLKHALSKQGFDVIQHYGNATLPSDCYDLVILDINLPYQSGFEYAKHIKSPILFLSAREEEIDILKGFSLGCEDYVTKPFSLSILIEKVKVILRRQNDISTYAYKNLSYSYDEKKLQIDKKLIALTNKEHEVLNFLISHKEQVITKQQLLSSIWDIKGEFVNESTVNVTINRLRKKMPTKLPWIQTVFGIGYKWSEQHEEN